MAQYAIEDTTMTALADAVRGIVGRTRLEESGSTYIGDYKVSKTPNALSFTERDGGYGLNKSIYDVITIPGATKIVIDIAYQNEAGTYDYVQVESGNRTSMSSSATKYANKTLTRTTQTFLNTDTITFYFKSDSSNDSYLGYYAECRGYDENDNIIELWETEYEEVPNTMTINEMIEKLEAGIKMSMDTSLFFNSGGNSTSKTATIPVGQIMENASTTAFILIFTACFSSTNYSRVVVFYDGAGNAIEPISTQYKTTYLSSIIVEDDIITLTAKNTFSNNYMSSQYKDCIFIWAGPKKSMED